MLATITYSVLLGGPLGTLVGIYRIRLNLDRIDDINQELANRAARVLVGSPTVRIESISPEQDFNLVSLTGNQRAFDFNGGNQ